MGNARKVNSNTRISQIGSIFRHFRKGSKKISEERKERGKESKKRSKESEERGKKSKERSQEEKTRRSVSKITFLNCAGCYNSRILEMVSPVLHLLVHQGFKYTI